MVQLHQLVDFVDQGRDDLRFLELGMIQLNLCPEDPHPESVVAQAITVTHFMAILRNGVIETYREMKALAEDMSNNSNTDRK